VDEPGRESSLNPYFSRNLKYYSLFQLMFVVFVVIFSSLGAFFHFLLDHEISIVESWLHNNQWELLILAKLLSLFILNRWFRIKLYEMKTIRTLVSELVQWPEPRAVVVSVFMLVSYLSLAGPNFSTQNLGYLYSQLTSYVGLFLFFGIEFIVLAYLDDMQIEGRESFSRVGLGLCYLVLFGISFRMSLPDYYHLWPYMVFCYSTLLILSGKYFKSWSNVVCFLLLFVSPMGALFGLDPVWGSDFSPFSVLKPLNLSFLAVIWVISFFYYYYRDKLLAYPRKFFR
jgi:hypothetical protein